MSDRRVHAELPGGVEIVRYDRAGKWYIEGCNVGGGLNGRRKITLSEAVAFAKADGAKINVGLPGGTTFDRKIVGGRHEPVST